MATFTISAGGGIVGPEEVQSRQKWGFYCVDGHTCLYLMRNDKKKVVQRRYNANSIHHFLFSLVYEKCSPWCLGTEATRPQPEAPQVPNQRKTEDVLKHWKQSLQKALPRGFQRATFSRSKPADPYHRMEPCSRWCSGLNEQGSRPDYM